MTDYSFSQLEQLWINAGGPSSVAPTAAAIALAESGGNPLAAYPGTTVAPGQGSTTDATGLWQILGLPSGNFTAAELTDPVENAKMAVAKYQQAGNSFNPWQTYTDGSYRGYLSGGAPSGTGVPTSPGGSGSTGTTNSAGGSGGNPLASLLQLEFPTEIISFAKDADTFVTGLLWLEDPSHWVRIVAFLFGVVLLLLALHAFVAVGSGGSILPSMPSAIPVPV